MFMSYVLKVFVDQVWIGNNSSESERRSAVIYAASFSAVVFVLTVVESNTESWMVKDMKLGFTVKQLRDSMATQVVCVVAASIVSKISITISVPVKHCFLFLRSSCGRTMVACRSSGR